MGRYTGISLAVRVEGIHNERGEPKAIKELKSSTPLGIESLGPLPSINITPTVLETLVHFNEPPAENEAKSLDKSHGGSKQPNFHEQTGMGKGVYLSRFAEEIEQRAVQCFSLQLRRTVPCAAVRGAVQCFSNNGAFDLHGYYLPIYLILPFLLACHLAHLYLILSTTAGISFHKLTSAFWTLFVFTVARLHLRDFVVFTIYIRVLTVL
jgi:hypothetical protein